MIQALCNFKSFRFCKKNSCTAGNSHLLKYYGITIGVLSNLAECYLDDFSLT